MRANSLAEVSAGARVDDVKRTGIGPCVCAWCGKDTAGDNVRVTFSQPQKPWLDVYTCPEDDCFQAVVQRKDLTP